MKLMSMFAPTLWSLLSVPHHDPATIQRHIVMSPPPFVDASPSLSDRGFLMELFADGKSDPHFQERNVIRFTGDQNLVSIDETDKPFIYTIPLRTIFRARNKMFPQYHSYSMSHYQRFLQSPYSQIMEYYDFCAMEDKLAHVFSHYIGDKKRHWLVWLDDPLFMDTDSIRSYGQAPRDVTWMSPSILNGNPDFLIMEDQSDLHM